MSQSYHTQAAGTLLLNSINLVISRERRGNLFLMLWHIHADIKKMKHKVLIVKNETNNESRSGR
jgi:hypothetical protein